MQEGGIAMQKSTAFRTTVAVVLFSIATSAADCMQECQRKLRDDVALCDKLYESEGSVHYHNTDWHKTCLANARTNFDNCKSTCK
jgi:hypothetical protein